MSWSNLTMYHIWSMIHLSFYHQWIDIGNKMENKMSLDHLVSGDCRLVLAVQIFQIPEYLLLPSRTLIFSPNRKISSHTHLEKLYISQLNLNYFNKIWRALIKYVSGGEVLLFVVIFKYVLPQTCHTEFGMFPEIPRSPVFFLFFVGTVTHVVNTSTTPTYILVWKKSS